MPIDAPGFDGDMPRTYFHRGSEPDYARSKRLYKKEKSVECIICKKPHVSLTVGKVRIDNVDQHEYTIVRSGHYGIYKGESGYICAKCRREVAVYDWQPKNKEHVYYLDFSQDTATVGFRQPCRTCFNIQIAIQ